MTDWQAVRDHVAVHVMGYRVQHDIDPIHGPFADYYDSSGRFVMDVDNWQPDLSWHEVGMVIEAMKGRYTLIARMLANGDATASVYDPKTANSLANCGRGSSLTFPQAVTLAAAYATEYEETT